MEEVSFDHDAQRTPAQSADAFSPRAKRTPRERSPAEQAGAASMLKLLETRLAEAVSEMDVSHTPPILARAVRGAVMAGGGRVRPRLALAVARACGAELDEAALAAAIAFELVHCASLVHDDLPCFDDADTRRGVPSTHAEFGQPIAVLVGDGLIVRAFEVIARATRDRPELTAPLILELGEAVGFVRGIVAGQGWESEPTVEVAAYHRAKTAALFVGAARAGAIVAGDDPEPWRALGERLGEAYQVADDLRDVLMSSRELGKPSGQDKRHERPTAMGSATVSDTMRALDRAISDTVAAIPDCQRRDMLETLVRSEAKRLVPDSLRARA